MIWEFIHNYIIAQKKIGWLHGDINPDNIMFRKTVKDRSYVIDTKTITIHSPYSMIFMDYSAYSTTNKEDHELDRDNLLDHLLDFNVANELIQQLTNSDDWLKTLSQNTPI